jgi:hypothetical protein
MRLTDQAAEYLMLLELGLLSPEDLDGTWAMRVLHVKVGLGRRKPSKRGRTHDTTDPREVTKAARRRKANAALAKSRRGRK